MKKYSSRTADKFVLRLPDGVREVITELARTHHQSMNGRMVCYIEEGIKRDQLAAGVSEDVSDQQTGVGPQGYRVTIRPVTIGLSTYIGMTDRDQKTSMFLVRPKDDPLGSHVLLHQIDGPLRIQMELGEYAWKVQSSNAN